jgi:hypothetical protein
LPSATSDLLSALYKLPYDCLSQRGVGNAMDVQDALLGQPLCLRPWRDPFEVYWLELR